ncbi:MAG: hypothetical protein BAJALOKI2v1_90040 [Promethearchaeota archaeon]|nr:MAG: hypothetical protein BAJALOKI2v1_90040 [Candidatus Lokiarchaeota archaeon]
MPEIKLFVDTKADIQNKVLISTSNAEKLGITGQAQAEIVNPDNDKKIQTTVEASEQVLDFAGKFAKNVLDQLAFSGVELIVRSLGGQSSAQPSPAETQPQKAPQTPQRKAPPPRPQQPPSSMPKPQGIPQPTPPKPPRTPGAPSTPPQQMPSPPKQHIPGQGQPSQVPQPSGPGGMQAAQPEEIDPYPNRIDPSRLRDQKDGIILKPVVSSNVEGGRVHLSGNVLQQLGLGHGMLIGWEDPLTRSEGSARITQAQINDNEIRMSKDTKEDTFIKADNIVVYSTEPPIKKASEISLEVQSQPEMMGYCLVSPRTQHTLSLNKDDVVAFEDELTAATGAAKVDISEDVDDNVIIIDSEILEASGIGSFEVKVSKNQRKILPLQSVSLGISPITGENMWELISTARENAQALKDWLSNYIIFKGIKLRWKSVNLACSIVDCVPDLTGDILAQITENTTLNLSPQGLVPFNAILIIDISRSMMARDVFVTNIAPAIEGIKAAMESREIQEFLKKFKDGVNIPRRISAAFAAVLFLSEKVGRGFGEKVSVIRFADEAQILPFGNSYYMDSASGKKGVLEDAARMIVDRIGNAYGQATNMGDAMLKARSVLNEFENMNPDQPTMIVLLTDGMPTDGNKFFEEIQKFSGNPNVVIYILGLGNPEDELMERAAKLCGGEYFKPDDAGELLVWYSKRARDLTVKMKAHK